MNDLCKLCGKEVNPHDPETWKEITGFVGGPKKDSMVLRTDTGNFACSSCIHKAKLGQAPEQNSLFDNPVVWTPDHDPIKDLEAFIEAEELGIGDE